MKPRGMILLFTFLMFIGAAAQPGAPPQYLTQPGTRELPPRYQPPPGPNAKARLAYWNEIALCADALDHTPAITALNPGSPDQLGPARSSRALAIVHLAVFDGINAIYRRYPSYSGPLAAFDDTLSDAVIAQAAHDTLATLYPRQRARLDDLLRADLARLPAGRAKLNGVELGKRAASAILALRANDGTYYAEALVGQDYFPASGPGVWRPDPVSRSRIALGAYWRRVRPFVIISPAQFRAPPPPALTSDAYARAFNEVRQLGGDGITTPTQRSAAQTAVGIFWSYDGSAWIGTPPRLYNQIAVQLAMPRAGDALELARALALVNAAMADAAIAVWDSKYAYDFWRPVTAIREGGDGNFATRSDPGWTPLGSQASNLTGPDFTPPFPAYVSGHSGLGSAMFQMLRRLYGDGLAFTFVSDELNGITRDNDGTVRPRMPRGFQSLSQAEYENGQSRIYLGVHWQFDRSAGMVMGRGVADEVFRRGLVRPAR